MQDTFFVDQATYAYRSLEVVADTAANVVYRLLGVGIDGRAAALELMKLHEVRCRPTTPTFSHRTPSTCMLVSFPVKHVALYTPQQWDFGMTTPIAPRPSN